VVLVASSAASSQSRWSPPSTARRWAPEACDLAVAAHSARFGLPEVRRGLIAASGGALRPVRRIPAAVAMEHLLTGGPMPAERALELGLVNRIVPAEAVLDQALELADAVTANGPLAVAASKRLARSMLSVSEDEGWGLNDELTRTIMASAHAAEAAQDKREPRWEAR
jgi:enoyl-CoA hydratase/carnithine racemase